MSSGRSKRRVGPAVGSKSEVGIDLPPYLTHSADGYQIRIKVVPGASKSEIVGVYGDRLKVRIAAPPEKGRANSALLALLHALPNVQEVFLVSGETSPEKVVKVICDGPWELSL